MALPKEPRQKMINLMYLVLTALLALNVSAEILNAFKTVDNSLIGTNKTVNQSTQTILASLEEKKADPASSAKANIWYPKAKQAQTLSDQIYNYIQGLRARILKEAGFDPATKKDSSYSQDNLDIATRIMVEEGEGKKLLQQLEAYKKNLLAIDPLIAEELKNSLQINLEMPAGEDSHGGGARKTWEGSYFRMVPTVAAITILSKFQNDIRTSENKVVTFCHEQVGKVAVVFDTYAAVIGQSSNYLMPGQQLEITAGVGAFSKKALPTITIGGTNAPIGEDGAAHWTTTVNSVGIGSIPVRVSFTDQEGNRKEIVKTIEYTVGQANTSIALDKMNVLFIGVDNPVTIAASGGSEQIQASMNQGSLVKVGPGKYIARVTNPTDDCRISVSVSGKAAGAQQFRVRTIPDPSPVVGRFASGENVPASAFRAQGGVGAFLKDFFFDAQFRVTSFRITGDGEGFEDLMEASVNGNAWSGAAQAIVNKVRPGSFITIEDIRCVGPDGRTRKLPPLLYNIK
jgi:gliding motility-associated protein GldM